MKINLILLLTWVLLLVATPVSAEIMNLNQTHGETWIRWTWSLNSTDYLANNTFAMYLDGASLFTYALNTTSEAFVPDYYYLTDLSPHEEHIAKLVLSNATATPPTVISTKSSVVTTSLPSTYYYVVLLVVLVLMVSSILLAKYGQLILALVFVAGSTIFSGYLSITTFGFNQSFSLISMILAIISLVILIYIGYGIYDNKTTWRSD